MSLNFLPYTVSVRLSRKKSFVAVPVLNKMSTDAGKVSAVFGQ